MHPNDLALPGLSENTRAKVRRHLTRWLDAAGHNDLRQLLADPDAAFAALRASKDVRQTHWVLHSFLSAAIAALQHTPDLGAAFPAQLERLQDMRSKVSAPAREHYDSGRPSERQRAGMVTVDQLAAARDALPSGSIERLLLGMYTLVPPARADYNACRIYPSSAAAAGDQGNHVVLPRDARQPASIVLTEYKTQRNYGRVTTEVPPELRREMEASLSAWPRAYLFSQKNGEAFTPSAFSTWANRALRRVFGRPVTLTILRHAFVSALDFNRLTYGQLRAVSRAMMHSLDTQKRYHWVAMDGDHEAGGSSSDCTGSCLPRPTRA